jgi:phosphocarrier protein
MMQEFEYTIKDPIGIHARPAGGLARLCKGFKSAVVFKKGDKAASGNKLIALMAMAVKQGDTVRVAAEGPDEGEAIAELEKYFQENL